MARLLESMLFRKAYDRLFRSLGPSGWWPARTPFEVMVGAILTQNTSWKNAERAIQALKREGLLAPRSLSRLSPAEIAPLIRSSGYYNQKADRLYRLIHWFGAVGFSVSRLKKMYTEDPGLLRRELLGLSGIGPETADSILCYALQFPFFVVDAYTLRWLDRYRPGRFESKYETVRLAVEAEFTGHYPPSELTRHYNEFHALLVRLGNALCLKRNPRCDRCGLRNPCEFPK